MGIRGISNRDTRFYPPHNNSSVHLTTTTYVRRSVRITDGMRNCWTTLRDSALSSLPSVPTRLEWPFQEQRETRLTASVTMSDVSAPAYTNGLWPLLRPVSMAQKNKTSTILSPMFNPSTSPWTAQPDSSGWRDNRLAAQHLHRDLVWLNGGFQQLVKRRRRAFSGFSQLNSPMHMIVLYSVQQHSLVMPVTAFIHCYSGFTCPSVVVTARNVVAWTALLPNNLMQRGTSSLSKADSTTTVCSTFRQSGCIWTKKVLAHRRRNDSPWYRLALFSNFN